MCPFFNYQAVCYLYSLKNYCVFWYPDLEADLSTLHLTKEEDRDKEFFKVGKGGNYNITQNPWDNLQIFQNTGPTFLPMILFGQPVKKKNLKPIFLHKFLFPNFFEILGNSIQIHSRFIGLLCRIILKLFKGTTHFSSNIMHIFSYLI